MTGAFVRTVHVALLLMLVSPFVAAYVPRLYAQDSAASCGLTGDGSYQSPNYDYLLSWDGSWAVEDCFSQTDYDVLRLTNGSSDVVLEGAPNPASSAGACVEAEYQRLTVRDDVEDLTLLEQSAFPVTEWEGAARLYAYTLLTDDGAQAVFGLKWCSLVQPGTSLVITQIGPIEDFEAQLAAGGALLGGLGSDSASLPAPAGSRLSQAEQRSLFVADLEDAIQDIDAFWTRTFPTLTATNRDAFTPPIGYVMFDAPLSACGEQIEPGGSPFYCPLDQTVYLDLLGLEFARTEFGPFIPATIIAHEVGHHVQALLGIERCDAAPCFDAAELTPLEFENMADCFQGAWARDAEQRGRLQSFDIERALVAHVQRYGDPVGVGGADVQAHGRGALRA